MKRLILTITLLFMSTVVQATYTTVDDFSCGKYISKYDQGVTDYGHLIHLYWINGYLTGRNYAENGVRWEIPNSDSIELWLNDYCQQNLLKSTVDAAEMLADELEKNNQ